ncbi:MAG: hypothetical protein ACI9PP_002114 [Halobacteriales archaeon]|jgi:hypothetical protein
MSEDRKGRLYGILSLVLSTIGIGGFVLWWLGLI